MTPVLIEIVTGKAGTGKSYSTIEKLKNEGDNSTVVILLAPTHSTVKNLTDYYHPLVPYNASTIYSFFRINWKDGCFSGCNSNNIIPPAVAKRKNIVIVIDEFTMIHRDIISKIIKDLNNKLQSRNNYYTRLILIGDPLQLPPISSGYVCEYDKSITFEELENLLKTLPVGTSFNILKHAALSPYNHVLNNYSSAIQSVEICKEQKRIPADMMKDIIIPLLYGDSDSGKVDSRYLLYSDDIAKTIFKHGYILISGTYKTLQYYYDKYCTIHSATHNNGNIYPTIELIAGDDDTSNNPSSGFKRVQLWKGAKFIVGSNSSCAATGDIIEYTGDELLFKNVTNTSGDMVTLQAGDNISPYNFLSVHKAQGRTFNNVIVTPSDFFLSQQLYVALTRASKRLKILYGSTAGETLTREFQELEKLYYP